MPASYVGAYYIHPYNGFRIYRKKLCHCLLDFGMIPGLPQRRSIRVPNFDYASERAYFITICTYDRICLFGKVVDREMDLNPIGEIVAKAWARTRDLRPNVEVDVFTVMPNHLHGILVIEASGAKFNGIPSTGLKSPSQTIGSIVRGFKDSVVREVGEAGLGGMGMWQRNYYEHIIRNRESYERIADYIIHNPERWEEDRFYQANPPSM